MRIATGAALAAMILGGAGAALAAAPVDLDDPAEAGAPAIYQLDTDLVVHNWVLCVSQASAESLARAREESVAAAEKTYADLAAAKACGKFRKLGVQLHEPLYRTAPGRGVDARVFGALVNIGAGWQSGFVVAGGLPE
jgi:hypothetical protein